LETRISFSVVRTEGGWIGLKGTSAGLTGSTLPAASKEEARQLLGLPGSAHQDQELFKKLAEDLQKYFRGERVEFVQKLVFQDATQFEISVWMETSRIPYGQTRSYSQVAANIGRPLASRAVGSALGKNPLPVLIPCHRVIGKNHNLRGFGGGLPLKRYLLDLEGISL